MMNKLYSHYKRIFALVCIFVLFIFSFPVANNELNEHYWKNTSIHDVMKRFDSYPHFIMTDKDKRTLAMISLLYTTDSHIPLYFLMNKHNNRNAVDKYGKTALDYALENPNMEQVVKVLQLHKQKNGGNNAKN